MMAMTIVAILAALLLPAVSRGKWQARRVQCLSQLQQWSLAMQLYAYDNEDTIPRRGQGVRPLTKLDRSEDWFNALPPEMEVPGFGTIMATQGTPPALFVCPEAKPVPSRYYLAYAMNMYLSPSNRPEPHHTDEIPSPETVVFLSDGGVGYSSSFPAFGEYSPQPRHQGLVNLVFVDGHAQGFAGDAVGCNTGNNRRTDVTWRFDTNAPPFAP